MDIQIKAKRFKRLMRLVEIKNVVKDLVLHADKNKIFARFVDETASSGGSAFYGEVHEQDVIVKETGNIKIQNLSKLIKIINRFDDDSLLKIVSDDERFLISEGSNNIGKMKAEIIQASPVTPIVSYSSIENAKIFDINELKIGDSVYETGVEITLDILLTLTKDIQAFSCEMYKFRPFTSKKTNKSILRCIIEDGTSGEKLIRVVANKESLGHIANINEIVVSDYLTDIIKAISNALAVTKETIQLYLYFTENKMLITDKNTFWYNLGGLIVD